MVSIKQLVMISIEEEKNKKVAYFEEQIKKVENSSNLAELISLVTNTFGNSQRQSELLREIISSSFKSDFIGNSEILTKTNEILITDGTYTISIPKSYLKSIKVSKVYVSEVKKPTLKLEEPIQFYDLYMSVKVEANKENKENLVRFYLENIKGVRYKLFGNPKFEAIQREIDTTFDSMINKIYKYNENLDKWKDYEQYLKNQETNDFKFIMDVKRDLKQFEDASWRISYSNLNETALKLAFA